MTSFPQLSYVCPIAWDTMHGDEQERYCSKCARSVVNISLLTREEREGLLANPPPGGLCVAYYQRLSGEHVSAENPLTLAESRRVVQWGVAAASMAAVAAVGAVQLSKPSAGSQPIANLTRDVSELCADVKDRGEQLLENLGLKKKAPPAVMMMAGMIVCAPTATSTPAPAATTSATPVATSSAPTPPPAANP